MAGRDDFSEWNPIEQGSEAIKIYKQVSAVDAVARHVPMSSDMKKVPRHGAVDANVTLKGTAYGEEETDKDNVELHARKITVAFRIADEDVNDSAIDPLTENEPLAATAVAKFFDNATICVSAVTNNGVTKPYNALYYTLTQDDALVGYTGGTNIIPTAGPLLRTNLESALTLVEDDEFADEASMGWLMHTSFKGYLRGINDSQNRPLYLENIRDGAPDTLYGYPIKWSKALRKTTVATSRPAKANNALAVFGDMRALVVGDAKLPGVAAGVMATAVQLSRNGMGFLTDESLMKVAMRKGFVVGAPSSLAIIEKTAS